VIQENTIKYWCEYLDLFNGWERYVPDTYINRIKEQSKIKKVEKREYVAFDSKYLLSVFKSLNEDTYGKVLRKMFELRDRRLKRKAVNPPLMMQSILIKKLKNIYYE